MKATFTTQPMHAKDGSHALLIVGGTMLGLGAAMVTTGIILYRHNATRVEIHDGGLALGRGVLLTPGGVAF